MVETGATTDVNRNIARLSNETHNSFANVIVKVT